MNELTTQKDNVLIDRLNNAFSLLGNKLDGSLPKHERERFEPIPEPQCLAIIDIVENIDTPAGNVPEIDNTAMILVGAFPDHGKHDTNIYLSHLTMLLAEYPIETHEKAIFNLVRSCKWLPSISEVEQALGAVRGEWLLASVAARKDLKRIEKMKPPEKEYTEEERAANKARFDKLIAEAFSTERE